MVISYIDNWCLFESIDGSRESQPCRCCSPGNALQDDHWICDTTGRRWMVLDEAPTSKDHSMDTCSGNNCSLHPLLTPSIARWFRATVSGISWHDLLLEEEAELNAQKTEEQLALERAMRDAAADKLEKEIELGSKCNHIKRVQEAQAARYAARGKIAEPCKKLYSCQGGGKQGGVARPTTMHVSSECWRYEYTDPETGRFIKVHTCNWLHPGEDGWQPEWNTTRTFKPATPIKVLGAAAPTQNNRFQSILQKEDGWQQQQPKRKDKTNRNSGW
jgi:hypothetical protein